MSKKSKAIILTTGIVLLGFLRGYLFGNINWIYKTLTEGRMNQARHEFQFMLEWSPNQIVVLKWSLTVLFVFLFAWFTYLIVKIYFQNKLYNKITILLFVGIFATSALLFFFGKLSGLSSDFYHIVRTLMGLGQSFMPLMILFILFKFFPQLKAE